MMKQFPKPIRPENDDCCGGGGCCPCVWDTYFNALDLWEEQEEKEKALADAKKATSDKSETD
jgi:hypothetical protein